MDPPPSVNPPESLSTHPGGGIYSSRRGWERDTRQRVEKALRGRYAGLMRLLVRIVVKGREKGGSHRRGRWPVRGSSSEAGAGPRPRQVFVPGGTSVKPASSTSTHGTPTLRALRAMNSRS